MTGSIRPGDCVRIPDGRIGRVREDCGDRIRVRVRRKTSKTPQFLMFNSRELEPVDCPAGWMSPEGYNRYLSKTLARMAEKRAGIRKTRES